MFNLSYQLHTFILNHIQETQHTDVLVKAGAEEALRQRFSSLQQVHNHIKEFISKYFFLIQLHTLVFFVSLRVAISQQANIFSTTPRTFLLSHGYVMLEPRLKAAGQQTSYV